MGKVEERLWSIIRNFANLGRDHPAMLVNAVRIIELQELVDRSLESSAGGALWLPQATAPPGSAEGHAAWRVRPLTALLVPFAQDIHSIGASIRVTKHARCQVNSP